MKTHKDLDVWKDSLELTNEIYSITKTFPKFERFGLSSQMERAAVSITSNIAEGAARGSDKEFIRFLYISIGSISELETQLFVAQRQNYINDIEIIFDMITAIRKRLYGLIKYFKSKTSQ